MSGLKTQLQKPLMHVACTALVVALAAVIPRSGVLGESTSDESQEGIPITLRADFSQEWQEKSQQVAILRGRCRIAQGETALTAQKMVIWRWKDRTSDGVRERLAVYMEGDTRVERPQSTFGDSSSLINLTTRKEVSLEISRRLQQQPGNSDALYQRGLARRKAGRRGGLQQTQLTVPSEPGGGPSFPGFQGPAVPERMRRIRIFQRSAVPYNVDSFESKETTPPEQVSILTGGVIVLIEGVDEFGVIDLAADRVVIWTRATDWDELQSEQVQSRDTPFQIYLEGNIVIRQGENVLRASRAFYDAKDDRGLMLDAELKAFIPQLGGSSRVRAERIRQQSRPSFHAQQAWVTTSQFGKPGYRLQATDIFLESRAGDCWVGPGAPIDPLTGAPLVEEVPWVTSLNNTFFLEDVPLLYLPYLSGPADDPQIPIRNARVSHDRVFGGQANVVWDAFTLLGLEEPRGVTWDLLTDYYTKRGPGIGTAGEYEGTNLFGVPGTYSGEGLLYYVHDEGEDNLGLGRRNLEPEDSNRGRAFLRHRQDLPPNISLFGEIGYLSDRNFLEQYYEEEFDEGKDNETLLYLKQQHDNWAATLLGQVQLNEFANTTEWLPRADIYSLSEPLFGGRLNWSSHTSVGYANLEPADTPTDPADVFTPLPYVADVEGPTLMSRHELDVPFNIGPVNLVPYVLGEAAYWEEDFTRDEISRLYGSAGVRSSLMFWRVFPFVQSRIFNLNGLAHKMLFEADYAFSESSEDLSNIPQYHDIDENAQERFRQRFLTNTFGGTLPAGFDPRSYAVRTGAGRYVTAPYHELVDDQQVLRLAWRQRLQTKVGPPERLRTKDWMALDLEASYFPKPSRDNFGEEFGLLSARYRWNVGERTTLLADALYDVFDPGQELWSLGVLSQRSARGSVFLGIRQIKGGDLDSQILTASYSYVMGPKWISTFGTAFDLAEGENRGQSLTITRVGADFLVHVGGNYDQSKDNVGIAVSIEPRFGNLFTSPTQLGSLLGAR